MGLMRHFREPSKQQSTAKVCKQSARANPVQFHVAHMRGNRFKKVLSASRTIRVSNLLVPIPVPLLGERGRDRGKSVW